jgi:general secretion pathway protein E
VVATVEPYLREWERNQTLGQKGRSALSDRIYNLARSVKKPPNLAGKALGFLPLSSLSNWVEPTVDQHIVNIVDWLWQYAFDQRASDIHMSRDVKLALCFRIDGVLHQVYQIPMSVMAAMVSRIKILGRMDLVESGRRSDSNAYR